MGPRVGDTHVFGSMEVGWIGLSRWFHGFWLVSIVFQGDLMVVGFHGFFKVVSWFLMAFGWIPWFFKVISWFLIVFGWFQ